MSGLIVSAYDCGPILIAVFSGNFKFHVQWLKRIAMNDADIM